MTQYLKVDENGFYLEPVISDTHPTLKKEVQEQIENDDGSTEIVTRYVDILDENGQPIKDESMIATPCPDGLFKAKWNGSEWVEGLSDEEINNLKRIADEAAEHQPPTTQELAQRLADEELKNQALAQQLAQLELRMITGGLSNDKLL